MTEQQPDLFQSQAMIQRGRRFMEFNLMNPRVYTELVKLALRYKSKGVQRSQIQLYIERLRWNPALQTKGEDFKMPNEFAALYSRKIMSEVHDLKGFFVTKPLSQKRGYGKKPSQLDQEFLESVELKPEFAEFLDQRAMALVSSGRDKIGIKALWEEMRKSLGATPCDNLRSRYSRYLMANNKALAGKFTVRVMKGEAA